MNNTEVAYFQVRMEREIGMAFYRFPVLRFRIVRQMNMSSSLMRNLKNWAILWYRYVQMCSPKVPMLEDWSSKCQ
jgi:hypothetical protein